MFPSHDKEADDEMYALAKQAEGLFGGNVYVYSGDNDLIQAVDDRVFIIRNKTDSGFEVIDTRTIMTKDCFVKKFHGVNPENIVKFRAIVGDPSDSIKGISRFPRDIAFNYAMGLYEEGSYKTSRESIWMERLKQNIDVYERNYKMMKLSSDYEVQLSKPQVNVEVLQKNLDKMKIRMVLS